jgi:threonine dehydrogenase-like Zn-dependent dehydrogenase
MQALWLETNNLTFRTDASLPELSGGEALLKVRLAGICGTDLELVRGYYPFTGVPGHEFVGEVVSTYDPARSEAWLGQRVVGEINVSCGECQTCLAGYPTHCERRQVVGLINREGAFAQYIHLPLRNLHRVPSSLPDEAAVFTEPLASALQIQQQVQIHPTDRVLLIGAGRLGLLIAQTLVPIGCDLLVLAHREHQQTLLKKWNIACVREDQIPQKKVDVVIEASGSPEGFNLAVRSVRPRGTVVVKSTYLDEIPMRLSSIVVDEVTIVGSRCGPFDAALRLLEKGSLDTEALIDSVYQLPDGLAAFKRARQPGVLKVLLKPWTDTAGIS